MSDEDLDHAQFASRSTDIGVISAFRLAGVLFAVLGPMALVFGWYVHTQIERAVLMNNAMMAERYVTKAEQEQAKRDLTKRLDDIQRQLEQNQRLTEKVAIRLKVDP